MNECSCPVHGNWINADDSRRLVRELDVLLNGAGGSAKQASLCDIVSQVAKHVRQTGAPLLASAQPQEAVASEMPWPWSIDESDPEKAACIRDANGDIVAEMMYRKDAELCLRAISALVGPCPSLTAKEQKP